ncbi:MAG: dihydroorotase [Planctomycetota bacterium]
MIRGANVVFSDGVATSNVLIQDGKFADLRAADDVPATRVIDASGLHLMPGVIDDQVHFRDPGLTHKEDLRTASRACAAGGVTSFLEMPNTQPPAVTVAGVHAKQRIAAEKSLVNYGFYIGATPDNVDELIAAGDDPTIPGIKIFIGSSTGNLLVDDQDALETIFAKTSLPICAHCEDESTVRENARRLAGSHDVATHSQVRDHRAAMIATRRAIDLATRHEHPFHVLHVSTAAEVPVIRDAPDWVTAEVCVHHLFFNIDDYDRLGTRIQMNPSIKNPADNEGLWQALLDGVITVIATDHAPHTLEEKSKPYPESPSGLPAVENSLALMLNQVHLGRCDIKQVARWMCEEPARVWNFDKRGKIQAGFHADCVLVDLNEKRTIQDSRQHTKSKWSPWHGEALQGWPVQTFVGGRQVWSKQDGFADVRPEVERQLTFRSAN